jgi:hypothetical protein
VAGGVVGPVVRVGPSVGLDSPVGLAGGFDEGGADDGRMLVVGRPVVCDGVGDGAAVLAVGTPLGFDGLLSDEKPSSAMKAPAIARPAAMAPMMAARRRRPFVGRAGSSSG